MTPTAPPLRGTNEADVSTKQPPTQTDTRLPGTHGHAHRTAGAQAPSRQGAQAPDGQRSTQTTALSAPAAEHRLPKANRLRRREEFLALQRNGRRRPGRRFVVITALRRDGGARLGITVSRQVGGAVVRNRVKRLVREFFRRCKHDIVPPRDIIVIARPDAATATAADVARELTEALKLHAGQ